MSKKIYSHTGAVVAPLSQPAVSWAGPLVGMALLCVPAVATAQQDTETVDTLEARGALEEIVVTAERREQSLQDIPSSITAFDAERLERTFVQDVSDYFLQTPNVTFQEAGRSGHRSIDIAMRGVSNIGGDVDAFAVYLDEFNIANVPQQGAVNPALEDVERIEVLRGPQGTFFGRNATGGAINITTRKPGPEFEGRVETHYGRFNTWGAVGVVNVPVVEDKFFVRAVASYEQSDGFVRNVNQAGGRSDYEFVNLRLAARWHITDRLRADLTGYMMREDSGLNPLVPTGVLDVDSASLLPPGVDGAISDGLPFFPENTTRVNHDLPLEHENRTDILNFRLHYSADRFEIVSITGYLDSEREFVGDLDFTSNGFFTQDLLDTADSWSQEIRVQSATDGPWEWTIGGIYAEDNNDDFVAVEAGPGMFFGLPDDFPIDINFDEIHTDSWAIFGQVSWRATERLKLTLGGRYSEDEVADFATGISFGSEDPISEDKSSFSDFSPRASIAYDWTDEIMTYFTVSKGYKAGGIELNTTLPEQSFDEEKLWNFEGGIRSYLFDRRMLLNLTGFYMDWKDLQVSSFQTVVDPDTGAPTFINTTANAADAHSAGVELEFAAQPTERLNFGGSVGYLDAEFDDFPNAVITGEMVDLSGEDMIRSPEWTLHLNGQYNHPLGDLGFGEAEAFFRAEYTHRSETKPNIETIIQEGFPNFTPAFDLVNVRAGIETANFKFEGFVENLFEESYFTGHSNFGLSGIRVRPHPSIWGLRLTAKTN